MAGNSSPGPSPGRQIDRSDGAGQGPPVRWDLQSHDPGIRSPKAEEARSPRGYIATHGMSDEHTQEAENASLSLVRETQSELASSLNSLGGKGCSGVERFIGFSGREMNHAVDGYISLRESGRIGSSKLLVRPAIEIMLRARAVSLQPSLIYRILFKERIDRAKWMGPIATKQGIEYDDAAAWDEFKRHCEAMFPGETLIDAKLSLRDIAGKIGLGDFYDSTYRTYCQFTHATLEAISGDLNELTDPADNRIMAICTLMANRALFTIGAEQSDRFESLAQKMSEMVALLSATADE